VLDWQKVPTAFNSQKLQGIQAKANKGFVVTSAIPLSLVQTLPSRGVGLKPSDAGGKLFILICFLL
jgi:hypothetical protein